MNLPESALDLIYRVLMNDADEEDIGHLKKMLESDPELESEFKTIAHLWKLGKYAGKWDKVIPDTAWQKILEKRNREIFIRKHRFFYWRTASVILLLLGVSIFVLNKVRKPGELASYPQPLQSKAELVLASGEKIALGSFGNTEICEGNTIISSDSAFLVYRRNESLPDFEIRYNELIVPRGGEYRLRLADGTTVFLNSESRLKYPVSFSREFREVELEGEAYFEVAPHKSHLFVVRTPELRINVLGTGFNVMAYRDETYTEVTLIHGKVGIISTAGDTVLEPEEQLVYDRIANAQTVRRVVVDAFVSWQKGILVFDAMPLEDLARRLSRWYDVDFIFTSEQLKKMKFSGAFRKHDDIAYVLSLIGETTDVEFVLNKHTITVNKK